GRASAADSASCRPNQLRAPREVLGFLAKRSFLLCPVRKPAAIEGQPGFGICFIPVRAWDSMGNEERLDALAHRLPVEPQVHQRVWLKLRAFRLEASARRTLPEEKELARRTIGEMAPRNNVERVVLLVIDRSFRLVSGSFSEQLADPCDRFF